MSIWDIFGGEKIQKVVPSTEQQQRYATQQQREKEIRKMAEDAYPTDDEQDPLGHIGAKAQSYDSNKATLEAAEFDKFRDKIREHKKEKKFIGLNPKEEFVARQILADLEEFYDSLPKIGPRPSFQEVSEKDGDLSIALQMIREFNRAIERKTNMNKLQKEVARLKETASSLDKNVVLELKEAQKRKEITPEEAEKIYLQIIEERKKDKDYLSKGDWGGVFRNTKNYVKKEIKRQQQITQTTNNTKKDDGDSWFGW